jgi:hypothetical protein
MRYATNLSGYLLNPATSSFTAVVESVGVSFVADVSSLLSPDPAVSAIPIAGAVVIKRAASLRHSSFGCFICSIDVCGINPIKKGMV